MKTCPNCARENADDARFCSGCATPLVQAEPAREERKVITVLFADLVGFTSKAETMDPEDVRAMLSPYYARLRSEIERFGGTVEKFIGDAVMALFGAPVAHEDDPERAVRAALAIRDWVLDQDEKLQLRIAVSTGEALISLGARPSEGEGMASGDVVNTTARLQSAAPVNGILVGEQTFRATRHTIEYRDAPAVTAKGKSEPIPVWEAVEAQSRLGVDLAQEERTPLVGRDHEIEALRGALARAKRESSPQLVTLVGEPGIGKSRLVYELRQAIEGGGGGELTYWRQGRSLPYGEGVAFWALSEMVKAQAGILEGDANDVVKDKLRRAVSTLVEDEADTEWILGHMRPLVGLTAVQGSENTSDRFAAWRRFFESMAERHPMVMIFEDTHWANDELLDFIDHLIDWATGVPLLVVCTARPELLGRRPGWGGGKSNAITISLSPMSDDDTARLIAAVLDRSVMAAETQAKLLARAGGNPLYAEQYARMFVELGGEGDLPLPESVQGLIAARLDALSKEEKSLLQEAAVVGKVFWLGTATSLTGIERRRAEEILHGLERKEFLWRARRSSVAGETEYSFRHVLVRDVAYGQLPRAARSEKHSRAAEWIDSLGRPEDHAEMVAHHYDTAISLARATGAATKELEDRARVAFRAAGDKTFALQAYGAAATFYEKALALWPGDGVDKEELRYLLGNSLRLSGNEQASEVLGEAGRQLENIGERVKAALAFAALGEYWWFRGIRDRVAENIERARLLIEGAPPSPYKARVLIAVSRFLVLADEGDRGVAAGTEAIELLGRFGPEADMPRAQMYLALARWDEDPMAAILLAEEAQRLAFATKGADASVITTNLAVMWAAYGDFRKGAQFFWQASEMEKPFEDSPSSRHTRGSRGWNELNEGKWDAALIHANEFIAEAERSPHYNEWIARVTRSYILLARDDLPGALAETRRSLAAIENVKDPQARIPALAYAACAEHAAGNDAVATSLIDECLAMSVAGHGYSMAGYMEMTWMADALGRGHILRDAVTRLPYRTPTLEAILAVLDHDWGRAADLFADMGFMIDEPKARVRYGEELIEQGRRAEGVEQLERALAFYRSVGATRYVRQAEELIAASA